MNSQQKMNGWIFARMQDISLGSADGPFGSNLKKEHYTDNKEVRIIQLSNIGELGWKDANVKYTTFEHLHIIARSEAYAGDIIIAKMMPASRAIIYPPGEKNMYYHQMLSDLIFHHVFTRSIYITQLNHP